MKIATPLDCKEKTVKITLITPYTASKQNIFIS